MDLGLNQKVALVTGSSRGIGRSIALTLADEGCDLLLTGRDQAMLDETAAAIRGKGRKAVIVNIDLREERAPATLIDAVQRELGHLDVLVNNAAVVEIGSIETASLEQWRFVNAVIADGTFFGCKHAVRAMKEKGGTIVNISSVASLQGEPYNIAYTAAKGAVEAMTRSIAVHCVQMRYPIRCNSLHPGPIRTSLAAELPAKMQKAKAQGFVMPPGFAAITSHSATPEEIAPSVLYLASPASRWVNGTRLVVDHTQSITRGSVPV